MDRLTIIAAAALAGAYAISRAANARAVPGDDTDPADGATALDYANPWGAAERQVESYFTSEAMSDENVSAFLSMIASAEGTDRAPDPYRVCYSYRHTIADLSDHPAITGEWKGEKLPDAMCAGAGLGPGCVSTAAGRYQIIRRTWLSCKRALGLRDFSPASQSAAAVYLIKSRGALDHVRNGRIPEAVQACRLEWASLPGAGYGQPERKLAALVNVYQDAGGQLA